MSAILQKIKAEFNKIKASHTSYKKDGIRPVHDWNVMLTVAFTHVFILAIVAFYFYKLVDEERLFTVTSETDQKEVKINSQIMDKVVRDINTREANSIKIKENKLNQPDPSL